MSDHHDDDQSVPAQPGDPEDAGGTVDGTPTDADAASSESRRLTVTDAAGGRHEGWAIAADLVVVRSLSLTEPVSVEIDGRDVVALEVRAATQAAGDSDWTCLTLPAGSLAVDGEHVPPGFGLTGLVDPSQRDLSQRDPSRRIDVTIGLGFTARSREASPQGKPFWCAFFPKAPGC